MICQAPIRASAFLMVLSLLAGCVTSPQIDHHAVSASLKARLKANSRPLTQDEQNHGKVTLDVTYTTHGPVVLPITWSDGLPTIPARINQGSPHRFVLDTASQFCALEARTAVANHVTVLDPDTAHVTLEGTTGDERALIGLPEQCSIGTWVLERWPFFVRTSESRVRLSWWENHRFDMDIIGMNLVLKSCDFLTLDFPSKRVVFGIEGRFAPPSGRNVWKAPLMMRDGLPYVQLHTNGQTWTALLDSGFTGLLDMDKATAQRLKLLDKARPSDALRIGLGSPAGGEPSQLGVVTLSQLDSLGPRMVHIPTHIVPQRVSSKIGCALLRPFRVTLDFRRGLLWLEDPNQAR